MNKLKSKPSRTNRRNDVGSGDLLGQVILRLDSQIGRLVASASKQLAENAQVPYGSPDHLRMLSSYGVQLRRQLSRAHSESVCNVLTLACDKMVRKNNKLRTWPNVES
jgi:hypothetical protein